MILSFQLKKRALARFNAMSTIFNPGGPSLGQKGKPLTPAQENVDSFPRLFGRWPIGQLARRVGLVLLFAVVLGFCRWAAYQIRFDFEVPQQYQVQLENHWHWVILLEVSCLF